MNYNIKNKYLFLFCFLCCNLLVSQTLDLQKLFEEEKYEEILEKEAYNTTFTTKELFFVVKSYSKLNRQFESLLLLNRAIPSLIEMGDFNSLSVAYNLKAENLVELSKFREGALFCEDAMKDMEIKKIPYLEELCVKCGILFNGNEEPIKAYKTYKKIAKKKLKESVTYISSYASILANTGKYKEALIYLKKGLDIGYKENDEQYIGASLHNIARILIEKKEWKEAKIYLDSADKALRKTNDFNDKKKLYITYHNYYALQNDVVMSRRVLDFIERFNERIYNHRVEKRKKELSIINNRKQILNKKVTVINTEIETRNERRLLLFIVLISLIIAMLYWVLYIRYKNTKLKYEQILNEQELLSSQMTPHFIFNALSILQGMVLNNEHKKASSYVSKFTNILQFITKDVSQNFIKIEEEIIVLKDYVDLQNLSAKKNIELIIQKTFKENLLIPPMILQPFVENSIIHGFKEDIEKPTITINFKLDNNKLQCVITDNGIGLSNGEKKEIKNKTSLATSIVKDRFSILSKKMRGDFVVIIEDLKEKGKKGTEVRLQLPYQIEKTK